MSVLDVIIVNWNCGSQLRDCLQSIVDTRDSHAAVLGRVTVVDNGSTDGSLDGLEQLPLPLTLIRNATNRGFAAACNQGAAGSQAEFLLFLNPDTRLFPSSLVHPIAALRAPANRSVGIAGVQLLNDVGRVAPTCARFLTPGMVARKIVGLEHLRAAPWPPQLMTDWDHGTTATVDHVMGAFFLVRRELFECLGRFDERFFVYLEDLDFSLRARRSGWETLFLAEAQVYHKSGGASQRVKARRLYYALSSRVLYGFKHFRPWQAWLLLGATLLVEPWTRVVYALTRRSGEVRDTLTAFRWLWGAVPRMVAARHRPVGP